MKTKISEVNFSRLIASLIILSILIIISNATENKRGSQKDAIGRFLEEMDKRRASKHGQLISPQFNCKNVSRKSYGSNSCLDDFIQNLVAFQKNAEELGRSDLRPYSVGDTRYFITTSFNLNGYELEARGLVINATLESGKLLISVPVEKRIDIPRLDDEFMRRSQWDLSYKSETKNISKWISITPPIGVNLTNIEDHVQEGNLKIAGPDIIGNSTSVIAFNKAVFHSEPVEE